MRSISTLVKLMLVKMAARLRNIRRQQKSLLKFSLRNLLFCLPLWLPTVSEELWQEHLLPTRRKLNSFALVALV